MDPSEYEGTVERVSDPMGAFGGLEELLTVQNAKFVRLDLSKESDQIHISVFKIEESLQKWNEVSFNNLRLSWDEQAIKVAEYKEEVAAKKKTLGAKIRRFTTLLSSHAADSKLGGTVQDIESESKELISSFKAEFDFLTTTNKFSESAFLSTYKILRDVPDPSEELGVCLKVCVRAQETLSNAQEQLNTATKMIEEMNPVAPSSNYQSANLADENLVSRYESRIQILEENFASDLSTMRERLETESRNREHSIRSAFERQQLEIEQRCEGSLARKDSEISSLMNSLNDHNQRNLENIERQSMLESEVQKRRELEERLRTSLTELAAMQTQNLEMHANYDILKNKSATAEKLSTKYEKESRDLLAAAQTEVNALTEKIVGLKDDLLSRPPVDLSALAQSVGMVGGSISDGTFDQVLIVGGPDSERRTTTFTSWGKIESTIIDCIRRASSEATESRVREQDATKSLSLIKAECGRLQLDLEERNKIIVGLESDLLTAHNSLGDRNAMLKCYNMQGPVAGSSRQPEESHKVPHSLIDFDPLSPSEEGPSRGVAADNAEGLFIGNELERGSGGRGVLGAVLGESKEDRMISVVQGQRDRYMKIAHAKESEATALKTHLDRALEEHKKVSEENLELFQRLRVLRASSRRPLEGGLLDVEEEGGRKAKSRSRRDVKSNIYGTDIDDEAFKRSDGDALDRKYMHLYEEKIDPFKLEELDKQHILSRMNIFERGLAYLTRFFLHDQWARHALMVYLLLVHGFALCYVLQVLNPQLIEEVDSQMKATWSAQTLDVKEHPDVRYR